MSNVKNHLASMIEAVDFALGEGYARKNPELIGRLMQAEFMVISANTIQDGLYFLGAAEIDEESFTM